MTPDEGRLNDAEQIEREEIRVQASSLAVEILDRVSKGADLALEMAAEFRGMMGAMSRLKRERDALSPAGRRPPESSDVRHRLQLAEDAIAAQMRSEEHYASCAVCGAFREEHPELCPVGRRLRNEAVLLRKPFLGAELAREAVCPPAECEWYTHGYSMWETSCKRDFYFDGADGPMDAGFTHCPFCGKAMKESKRRDFNPQSTAGQDTRDAS